MGPVKATAKRRNPSRSKLEGKAADLSNTKNPGTAAGVAAASPGELPTELIDYVNAVCEPPRKRQKLAVVIEEKAPKREAPLDFIFVKEVLWEIECPGEKLAATHDPLERDNITLSVKWRPAESVERRGKLRNTGVAEQIEIINERKQSVYCVSLSELDHDVDDVNLALDIYRCSLASRAKKDQGSLWTDVGISLLHKDGSDVVRLSFAIKWAVTTSPDSISHSSNKTASLLTVLRYYYPDLNVIKSEWSPQDFYQAVSHPDKESQEWLSIETKDVESKLYPFQKRAVRWLLEQEKAVAQVAPRSDLPISFIKVKDARGCPCYVSHLFGLVARDITPFKAEEESLRGGILAEEMGLGKTLEMISLITLNKRPLQSSPMELDDGRFVRRTAATLIVTPPSILQQWISEIEKHAPTLKVFHYEGLNAKAHNKKDSTELLESLASADVVLATYSVLAGEVHYTPINPEKSLRTPSKYPRPKSPLLELSWWRVCMDEAQMIESGVSNAAVVARMIPRINAWCITGTPVRKDVNDLLGLLIFLRYDPYASSKHIWASLISWHKTEFRRLFGKLALRHSKREVRNELRLPPQRRYVITMPFTPIEEQHYQELFNQMCEEVGLNAEGAPVIEDWDPNQVTDRMRSWLERLRRTALHPDIGGRKRRVVGQVGPMRTVEEVLEMMMSQADQSIRTLQRSMFLSRLKRGQLYENSPRVKEALEIWEGVVKEVSEIVDESRNQLRIETAGNSEKGDPSRKEGSAVIEDESSDSGDMSDEETDPTSRIGVLRMRLRGILELLHMAVFFRANAYFQIKSNEEMTGPETPEFKALEKLEVDGYEEAKALRREILREVHGKTDRLMRRLARIARLQNFVQIPAFTTAPPKSGLESRRIMERLDTLATAMDDQATLLDDWREKIIQLLVKPLVDVDDGVDIAGDEYEESTKTQDEVGVYIMALGAVIGDRQDALSGLENQLVKQEVKTTLRIAQGKGEFEGKTGVLPEKTIELLKIRKQYKPIQEMGSVKGIVSELRALSTALRSDAESGNNRAQHELAIVDRYLKVTQKQMVEQSRAAADLSKELEQFTDLMNRRLEYYKQLQQVSDMVVPYEEDTSERTARKMLQDEEKLIEKIATFKAKRRYLEHLKAEAENPQEQRICIICREDFEIGSLTVCGHQYCKECMQLWWKEKKTCPVCKKKLIQADLHDITYKPQVLSVQAEEVHDNDRQPSTPSTKSRKSSIYSEFSQVKLAEIKNIELDGPSFTTKVDTLARHLIWLRESDPGAKSIIFSQFKDFLDVLANAFQKFRIGFSAINKADGIEKFKNDPSVECFLLHARAHSSGLNLVNASHVFLCEPLLNTALELQAIARVDRIGQQQETSVWLYLVDGTVEESIHQLSVKRRMEHIGKTMVNGNGKGKAKELAPDEEVLATNLEEANSMELQQASMTKLLAKKGGEMIEKEDLWDCLFGGVGLRKRNRGQARSEAIARSEVRNDREVRRYLGAEAAGERAAIS